MRDPSVLLQYAEDCIKRSWEVQDSEQKRILKETADVWKELAREVVRMNEFAESQVQASRAFRAANGLAAAEGSQNTPTWPSTAARSDPPSAPASSLPADVRAEPRPSAAPPPEPPDRNKRSGLRGLHGRFLTGA
jgi:hypothetical protein